MSKLIKDTEWMKERKSRGWNPDQADEYLQVITNELHKDMPCKEYLKEKMDSILKLVEDQPRYRD